MRILISGGAGFIGSSLIKELLKDGNEITAIDNFDDYYNPQFKKENITRIKNNKFKLYDCDINNGESLTELLRKKRFDKLIHLAAKVGVRNSIEVSGQYLKTNIGGTLNMLKLAKSLKIKDIIFTSSSSVYGNSSKLPSNEKTNCLEPLSPYAFSKRSAELLCYTLHKLYGFNITVLRLFSVYGPYGRPDMSPYLFTKSILNRRQINIFGDGSVSRDFTYIDDIVTGVIASVKKPFPFEIINLGSSHPVKIIKVVEILQELIGVRAILKYTPPARGESLHTHADISKARRLLNFKAKTDIRMGLQEFILWFKKCRFTI